MSISKIFQRTFSRITKSKNVSRTASKARAKPESLVTRPATNTALSPENSAFRAQAESIARSKSVQFVGKTAATGILIGGTVYGVSMAAGSDMEKLGEGYRNLTGNYTDMDYMKATMKFKEQEQDLAEDEIELQKDYMKFLKDNGLGDSPSALDTFLNFANRGSSIPTPTATGKETSLGSKALTTAAILAALGIGAYTFINRKGSGGKKK